MGPMYFASGSHRLGSLGDRPIGDASEETFGAVVRERGLAREDHAPFRAGDATFHAGWTLHGAPPNTSARMREVMTVIYYADGARVGPLDHPSRRLDRDVWLRGCEPGALAAGPDNPVLWRRDEEICA
jgi:ectoine hydroxylase-related dioxygenase (phytanoyl-CoA dioxygenase family)